MPNYEEGTIKENPKTGDRWQVQDGYWVNLGPSVTTDIKRSTIPELVRGAVNLSTAPRAAVDLAKRGIAAGTEKLGFPEVADRMRADIDKPPLQVTIPGTGVKIDASSGLMPGMWTDPASAMAAVEKGIGGEEGMYRPKTTAGKYWGAVMQALPGGVGGGPNAARNAVKTVTGALGGEFAGQTAENNGASQWWRLPGAMIGGLLPSVARRAWTPNPVTDPMRLTQAAEVEGRGVPLRAGQVTGSPWLQAAEHRWANSAGAPYSDQAQAANISRSLMRSTGGADELPYLNRVRGQQARNAAQRETLAAGTNIPFNRELQTDVANAADRARASLRLPPGSRVPGVSDTADVLFRDPATGRIRMGMTGPEYLEHRTNLRQNAVAATSPAERQAYFDMRNALDAGANRVDPRFGQIHERMANARALERTMDSGSNEAVNGIALPGTFHQQHSVPTSPTASFARSAQALTTPATRETERSHLPSVLGGAAGAYLAHKYGWTGGPAESLIAGFVGGGPAGYYAAYNPLTSRVMMSDLVQNYLRNQAVRPGQDLTGNVARSAKILTGSTPLREELEGYE